jgi:N-carbamoyl-L-amino-acid hydrolase
VSTDLAPDVARLGADLEALARFTEPDLPGWSRQVFSPAYRASRDWVAETMRAAGLEVHRDAAGNLVGVRPGTATGQAALVVGSHTDTVAGGGRFDGVIGVLGAIEVARMLREADVSLRHELRVVDFLGEEPNDFGLSCVGSRAISGLLAPEHLDYSASGRRLGEAMEGFGLAPEVAVRSAWSPSQVAAYVELHIEQGPRLERAGTPVGVVTAIAGIERLLATFLGRADHAGTMPMGERADALAAAAAAVLAVESTARCGGDEAVATTGRIEAVPGSLNVVPERARMWTEMRHVDAGWLDSARRQLADQIAELAEGRGIGIELDWLTDQPPVPTTAGVRDSITRSADALGLGWQAVPSGAGHDAAHMAQLGPMGMIFVPSREGKSHCPQEWTDLDQIATGVRLLAATLVELDTNPPTHLAAPRGAQE